MLFYLFVTIIVFQRAIELVIAKKNERWMKAKGAVEFGAEHYPIMVLIHTAFFITMILEVLYFNRELSQFWVVLFGGFLFTQAMRIWALKSLGPYWNTKIIVLPGAEIVKKGPYRYIKHPNYFIVALELAIIPLMFNAYTTAILFTILNMAILSIRIPTEEKALKEWTGYETEFQGSHRFLPNLLKKFDKS
ncbi:15-methylpalmitoyl-4-hydroxy-2-pyrone 4-O-methyltransferase [Mesobacillus persicus]|uniref:15-methylpalmitoyl-4-hydroxy-2-pyrone 4-O-methyltransferase n=1 Tax=Mesobacillus persicus TaxID=930146 RepID=A0A1H8BIZ5_9BACI|nr:isoprenylcysteine carboxyl methyltransferase family protein [Mesobacillus persicus]SEM82881.1 15-methylpalmitoyl-4-hydroxy-2-pyrone 4-O-methyltransferase [Mesobacillus persicus]